MNSLVFRQWLQDKIFPLLFTLCIVVSLAAYISLDVLQTSINRYVDDNQLQLVGGDLVLTSNQKIPAKILDVVKQLDETQLVFDYQFNAIAYTQDRSLLSRIKAVSQSYPLYGQLLLKQADKTWEKGSILVEQQVLTALELEIGDSLTIGEARFTIANELISEPDRPLTAFGFGARILMHESDLPQTQLMGQKSRINYRIEIKAADENKQQLFAQLSKLSDSISSTKINLKTSEQSNTSISNLSQNFLVFLKLLVVAVIVLSGVGLMSVVKAFIAEQQKVNAICAALGENNRTIVRSYRILFFSMAVLSTVLAWLVSLMILHFSHDIFASILPHSFNLTVSMSNFLKALAIALALTALMTHFSLASIYQIKPIVLLQNKQSHAPLAFKSWLWIVFIVAGTFGLLALELNSYWQGAQVTLGFVLIWLFFLSTISLLMKFIHWMLNKRLIKQWKLVLALQNIFRKGNQSRLFMTAISLTSMIIASISLLDYSVQEQLISTYPKEAPNVFLLDVQTNQQEEINALIPNKLNYYPVVRARIDSVNGVKADVLKTKLGRYDNINRIFNLSYGDKLLKTETLDKSEQKNQLFSPQTEAEPLSILNSFAEFLKVDLGDELVFNIQGIFIKTKISSIRKRIKRGPSPFFYFLLPESVLHDAPQIRFATTQLPEDSIAAIQTQLAQKFPGITVLNGASIANQLKQFVDQLTQLITVFTALSLLAGGLIFAASLLATSQDRIQESYYYRMMGMLNKDILKISSYEFLALGLFAFNTGILIASLCSYLIVTYWFSLQFIFPWLLFFSTEALLILLLLLLSFFYNQSLKSNNLLDFLRH